MNELWIQSMLKKLAALFYVKLPLKHPDSPSHNEKSKKKNTLCTFKNSMYVYIQKYFSKVWKNITLFSTETSCFVDRFKDIIFIYFSFPVLSVPNTKKVHLSCIVGYIVEVITNCSPLCRGNKARTGVKVLMSHESWEEGWRVEL